MSHEELTHWLLEHYGHEHARPGLARIEEALAPILGELRRIPVVTVAGTNGKGETTLWLSRELAAHRQCVWTSPHIERITERFRTQSGEIELAELERLVRACHGDLGRRGIALTFYEFLFFVFCHWALEQKPEYLLLEVGLGGRLDAVNVLDARVLLLPSISRDHQEYLGPRYDLILREKLGLLRPGQLLLSYLSLRYLREKTQGLVAAVGAAWVDLEALGRYGAHEFSARNQLLAHAAALHLKRGFTGELSRAETFADFCPVEEGLPFRGEVLRREHEWTFYGSHNVDGVRKLIQFLRPKTYTFTKPPFDAVFVSFSRRDARDLRVLLKMLKASGLGQVLVTTFDHPKAASRDELTELARLEGMTFADDIESHVLGRTPGQRLLVTGSYYFVGAVRARFCR
jgi:dihydrofolate synthase/folylpolyglutamate synthase